MKKLSRDEMKKVMGGLGGEACYKCCDNGTCSECSWSYAGAKCERGVLTSCHSTTYPCKVAQT